MNILFLDKDMFFKAAAELVDCNGQLPAVTMHSYNQGRGISLVGLTFSFSNSFGLVPDSLPLFEPAEAGITANPQEFLLTHGCQCTCNSTITYKIQHDLNGEHVNMFYFYQWQKASINEYVDIDLVITNGDEPVPKMETMYTGCPYRSHVVFLPRVIYNKQKPKELDGYLMDSVTLTMMRRFGARQKYNVLDALTFKVQKGTTLLRYIDSVFELRSRVLERALKILDNDRDRYNTTKDINLLDIGEYVRHTEVMLSKLADISPYFTYMMAQLYPTWVTEKHALTTMATKVNGLAYNWLLDKTGNDVFKKVYLSEMDFSVPSTILKRALQEDVQGPYIMVPVLVPGYIIQCFMTAVVAVIMYDCGFGAQQILLDRIYTMVNHQRAVYSEHPENS